MTPELFTIGGGVVLLVLAALGGGIEVKEFRVPQISPISRVLCAFAGAALVGISVYLQTAQSPVPSMAIDTPSPVSVTRSETIPPRKATASLPAKVTHVATKKRYKSILGVWITRRPTATPNAFSGRLIIRRSGDSFTGDLLAKDNTGEATESCAVGTHGEVISVYCRVMTSNMGLLRNLFGSWKADNFELTMQDGKLVGNLISNKSGYVEFERE